MEAERKAKAEALQAEGGDSDDDGGKKKKKKSKAKDIPKLTKIEIKVCHMIALCVFNRGRR